jgi:hypothetical protein
MNHYSLTYFRIGKKDEKSGIANLTLDLSPFLVKIYTPFDILWIHPASRQEIVLNIALCGDWAGNAWGSPGRGFRSGTEFEPGDPTKKKERKKWFER